MSSTSTRRGFVLLEAVVALMIISLFAVGLLTTVAAQVRTADRAAVLLTGRALAEDRFTALQLLDYESIKGIPDSLAAGVFPPPFEDYTWTAVVEPAGDEYDLFSTRIEVSAFGYSFVTQSMLHRPRPVVTTTTPANSR